MADEKKEEKEAEGPSEDGGNKKRKIIIIAAALGAVIVVAAVLGFLFLGKGSSDGGHEGESAHGEEKKAEEKHGEEKHGEEKKSEHGEGGKEDKEGKAKKGKAKGKEEGKGEHNKEEDGGHGKPAETKKAPEESQINFGKTYNLKAFHLNLGNPLENRYMRLEISVEYKNGDEQLKELEARLPQLRDAVLSVASRKTREFLLGPDGKDQLRLEILNRLNQYLDKKIEAVYITDLLIE